MQHSKTWNPKAPAYGKFWLDCPGSTRKRRTISLGVCATKTIARQRLRDYIQKQGINSVEAFRQNTAPGLSFRQQAEHWLKNLSTRKRRPVKPATVSGWRDALNAWLLPNLGSKLLAEVSNAAVRELVEKMSAAGLSAKTIVNYVQVVKLVVASATDDEGEQIFPRKWNHDFIQLPIIRKDQQYRPTVTAGELTTIIADVKPKYAVLFALLAGTGLRIGEALALRATDFGPDCRVLHIRRSIWRGKEQEPKTPNAVRVVDIPEHLAKEIREYLSLGTHGYLFATKQGKALQQRNVLRILHGRNKLGFHAFRRFRLTWLRRNSVPRDLERFWMGHASQEVGDLYSGLKNDAAFRQEWAERVGLGFELVHLVHKTASETAERKVA